MRKERRHCRSEGKGEGGGERRTEQRSEGEGQGRSVGGREIEREGNFKCDTLSRTLASIQRTRQHTTRPLPLRLWYILLTQNSKRVCKLCIVMRRNLLFDRWMT